MARGGGATLLAGRDFSAADRTEAMADWIWAGTSALGRRVRVGRPDEQAAMWPWMTVVASFGIVALVLTIVGVYGVIGYSVVQRGQEFGVRRALGAGPRDILWLIVREGLNLGAAGVAAGLALTLARPSGSATCFSAFRRSIPSRRAPRSPSSWR